MCKKIAIINSKCCRTRKNAYTKSLISKIKEELDADIVFTEYPGHAEKISKDSLDYGIIIVAGGDGTISQVVNGMNLETQAVGVIPLGTGNSLARDLGINAAARAIDIIKEDKRDKIDLLDCRFETDKKKFKRYAITTSGIGFASATVSFGNRYLKMTRPLCYILSACFKSFNQEVMSAKIQLDGSALENIEFTNLFINNTKHSANTCIFPRADLRDSAFNLLVARTNAFTQYLWNISILTRTYLYYPGEKAANRLHITLDRPSSFMLDGEIFDSVKEINYSVIPQKLTVFK